MTADTDGASRAGGVFRLTTSRPVAVTMAFVTLVTFGWVSLQKLPLNLLPDINYPRVTVRAEYPGAAPEDVEERVTERLHEALSVLGGLESISSISRAGLADVTLEFTWGTQLTFSIQDIRERLDRAILPLEVGTPIILRYDPTLDPILVIGLTGGSNLVELRKLAEDRLALAVGTVEGVAAVRVRGGLEDEIQVRLDPSRMSTYNLRPADVAARLAAENVNMASGTVLEGETEYLVRILNEYLTPEEIGRTILFRDGDSIVRLSNIADVQRTPKERDVITRIGEQESVELQVFKEADANIVELAKRVRTAVFGTAGQRSWVQKLKAGAVKDPNELRNALDAEADADPELAASIARVQKARRDREQANMGAMRGGDPPMDRESDASLTESEAAPLSEAARLTVAEQKVLDAATTKRMKAIEAAQSAREEAFEYLAADLPADVRVRLLSDQSRFIEAALNEVKDAGKWGALLAVVVLFLFLGRVGTTLIIAIAIPVSVVVTFAPLYLSGTSLNVMSLGGLALGIGMVVDNAIVILESIARRRELGDGPIDAAVNGTREVAGAATASTLTTVAVFAPIVFVEGIAGQVFRDQAFTVVASLLVSLIVALFLVPMLASRGGSFEGKTFSLAAPFKGGWELMTRRPTFLAAASRLRAAHKARRAAWSATRRALLLVPELLLGLIQALGSLIHIAVELLGRLLVTGLTLAAGVLVVVGALGMAFCWVLKWFAVLFRLVYDPIERIYPRLIGKIVASTSAMGGVLLAAALLMWWMIQTAGGLGSEMLPEVHQGEIIARLSLPVGAPLEATDAVARLAEQSLREDERVAWVSTTVGIPRDEISQPDEGEHTARLAIGLHPTKNMEATEEAVMASLRGVLATLPELRDMRFERPTLFSIRTPVVIEIKGDNLRELGRVAELVTESLSEIPGLRDVRSSVQPGSPEVMLSFDRDLLSRYNLDSRQLADTVADMVKGRVATRFSDDERKLDVLVQVPKESLQSLDDLLALPVNPTSEASEPLSTLSTSRVREGPREIRRLWGQRAAIVSASLSGFDVGSASEEIDRRIKRIERESDLIIEQGGQSREMTGALGQMTQALLLAVFLVYVVMASIFESLLQPLIILVTVPLAMVGAIAALAFLDIPLSVVVFIGAIILAGIVVNNAIVLIDAINRRRRLDGLPLIEAVRHACEMRLRPILMTTMTTVLGLLPLTGLLPITAGEGTELRAPMAITVVAGLSCATLLTLVVIPCAYTLVEGLLERMKRGGDAPLTEQPPTV
ncbi:MAG: efflux RND transporter permease subunit [Planctomycetota bacterium]|nr:efflux RND transporter permease subunit [Planctomycetota bacterium]